MPIPTMYTVVCARSALTALLPLLDVLLGADFLCAHRVLFAMGQERIYLSYNGAELFPAEPAGPAARTKP
jgi:hypothetical protein